MSWGPVNSPVPRGRDGGLIALGLLLLVQLAIELGVLGYDLSEAGVDYLSTALGFSYQHYVPAPVGFFGNDTALSVALLVLAVGAFSGGRWVRPAAVAVLGVNAYAAGALLVNQLQENADGFAEPVSHLVLNLTVVATLLIAVVVAAVVAATQRREPAPSPSYPPLYPPPMPPPAPPYPAGPPTG
ncbi:hypothetical protein OG871_11210 [Kitasatospora sp. NBC_00374]|uniref:hypothetical protein n=1 Tax=Kitasatospora sp. NBC_00374 TaxID=2975964 RepID=UPI0030E497AF